MALPGLALFTHPSIEQTLDQTKVLRTIVVDDSPVFVDLACFILEQQPAIEIIGTANDGVEAIETALLARPNLIVMDVHMPRLDGLSATTTLLGMLPAAKVILMSAENTAILRSECRRRGASFVPKLGFTDEIEAALQVLRVDSETQERHS